MRSAERALLPVLGIGLFLLVWESIVLATRPAPVRRPTLAMSSAEASRVCVVVLGNHGEVLAKEMLSLDAASHDTSLGKLRLWLGSIQPSLAAVPAGADLALLNEAKVGFGGGLEVHEVAAHGAETDPCAQALARATELQSTHSMRPTWLPDPVEALGALLQMLSSGEMLRHVVASLFRVVTGFAIAVALGIPFGLALGSFARLSSLTNSVIQCLRPISPIAWLPAATLALGGGDLAAVFLIFLAAFFPIAVSTAAAVATVDLKYRRSAQNFGVRGFALARRVILPASLPAILTALRIALGIAWVVVVAAEMLGVESGLGYLVLDARNQLRYDRVVAAMIAIGLIGLALDATVRRFERVELERRGLRIR